MSEKTLVELIDKYQPITRKQLENITSIAWTTLFDRLAVLILRGEIVKISLRMKGQKGRGRNKVYYFSNKKDIIDTRKIPIKKGKDK